MGVGVCFLYTDNVAKNISVGSLVDRKTKARNSVQYHKLINLNSLWSLDAIVVFS